LQKIVVSFLFGKKKLALRGRYVIFLIRNMALASEPSAARIKQWTVRPFSDPLAKLPALPRRRVPEQYGSGIT
jgi:hypothetical protein